MNTLEFIVSALEQTSKDLRVCERENELIKACSDTLESLAVLAKTLQGETGYKEKFDFEKACKNQVYLFILENGLFDKYKDWSKENPVEKFSDFHGLLK